MEWRRPIIFGHSLEMIIFLEGMLRKELMELYHMLTDSLYESMETLLKCVVLKISRYGHITTAQEETVTLKIQPSQLCEEANVDEVDESDDIDDDEDDWDWDDDTGKVIKRNLVSGGSNRQVCSLRNVWVGGLSSVPVAVK